MRSGDPVRCQRIVEAYGLALERGGLRVLREGHRGRVARCETPSGEVVVKHYRHEGVVDSLRRVIGGSRAGIARKAAEALQAAGLGVPPVIGTVDRTLRGLPLDSFLIMRPIPGALELDRWISRRPPGTDGHHEVRPMAGALARSIRTMHESGIFHADLKSCNILVDREEGDWVFVYLDLEDARERPKVPVRLRLENLAQLDATVPAWIPATVRMRFFLGVLGYRRLTPAAKREARRVLRRSREKDRVHHDGEGIVRLEW